MPSFENLSQFNPNTSNRRSSSQNRKDRNLSAVREGVLVNNLIKTNENYSSLNIPQKTYLPSDLYQKKEKIGKSPKDLFGNSIVPLLIAPLAVMGGIAGISKLYKSSFMAKNTIPAKDQLRSIGRIVTINDDNNMVLYLLTQDPSRRSLLAAASVLAASAGAFVMKNVVDGTKEVWVKKQKADIKRDLEENLIEIETRSFSGKNQILRNILHESSKEIKGSTDKISFSGYDRKVFNNFIKPETQPAFKNKPEEKKSVFDKTSSIIFAGVGTLAACGFLLAITLKNFGKVGKQADEIVKTAQKTIKKEFKDMSEEQVKSKLKDSKMSDELKNGIYKQWKKMKGEDSVFESAPELMGGVENKVSFISAVNDITAFLYTYIVNPTPQTRNLMLLVFSSAAGSYLGKTAVEGVKEVQVEKANAKTEVALQDRLVQVELENLL